MDSPQTITNARLKHALIVLSVSVVFVALMVLAIYFFSRNNMMAGIAVLIIPFPILFLYKFITTPRFGFLTVLFVNYFAIGLTRYISHLS